LRKAFKWRRKNTIGSLKLGNDGNGAVGKIVLVQIMSPYIFQGSKVSKPSIHSLMSSSSSSHSMLSASCIVPGDCRQITSGALASPHFLAPLPPKDVQKAAFQSKLVNFEIMMTSTREFRAMEQHNLTSVDAGPNVIFILRQDIWIDP
jgi:hypothetical protein